jgi:hypothetical protein
LGYYYLRDKWRDFGPGEVDGLLSLAEQLAETCYQMYAQVTTGLSPEVVYFNTVQGAEKDFEIKYGDTYNLLRPETIESFFYLYKVSNNSKYQDWGWKIFESFEKYTRIGAGGYSSIQDVTNTQRVGYRDSMESFWLGETLKYFYLLFDNVNRDSLSLKKWLFNTEAHLVSIF